VTCVAGNGRRKCGAIDQSLLFNNELGYQKFKCVHSWRFRFVSWLVLRKISNEDKRLSTRVLVILPTALITKNQAPWHWKLNYLFFKFRNASKHYLTESVAHLNGRTPVVYYRADSIRGYILRIQAIVLLIFGSGLPSPVFTSLQGTCQPLLPSAYTSLLVLLLMDLFSTYILKIPD
jgi:hypothetical protein